ncbi:nitrous oxide reductase accessory protein NosL [Paludibacterium purpuratum]|uniref:Copper chaperone NosL n=1 Tax=Paludibacterium purpuratum TaxID=1144873 RepID=A0A4R7BAD0_9NEIS|nr:nitrous oxide reductase accessory protein NosL [Paludibacterium purpuratum]TDR81533.1 copper chaperone NosL [Paludibacterium purpuratum]
MKRLPILVGALALAWSLTACQDKPAALPPPHEVTSATVSVLDGMTLTDYPGPKAQIIYDQGEPDFFCDTLGMFSVYLQPEQARKVRAVYVQDMEKTGWEHPQGHWIDAHSAFYVIGSNKRGAMGQTFASFGTESAAQAFIRQQGGKLYHFGDITIGMATTDGGVVKDQNM